MVQWVVGKGHTHHPGSGFGFVAITSSQTSCPGSFSDVLIVASDEGIVPPGGGEEGGPIIGSQVYLDTIEEAEVETDLEGKWLRLKVYKYGEDIYL